MPIRSPGGVQQSPARNVFVKQAASVLTVDNAIMNLNQDSGIDIDVSSIGFG